MKQNTESVEGMVAFLLEELKKEWTDSSQNGWHPVLLSAGEMETLIKVTLETATELVEMQESEKKTDFMENVRMTKKVCVVERILKKLKSHLEHAKEDGREYEVFFADDEWEVLREIIKNALDKE